MPTSSLPIRAPSCIFPDFHVVESLLPSVVRFPRQCVPHSTLLIRLLCLSAVFFCASPWWTPVWWHVGFEATQLPVWYILLSMPEVWGSIGLLLLSSRVTSQPANGLFRTETMFKFEKFLLLYLLPITSDVKLAFAYHSKLNFPDSSPIKMAWLTSRRVMEIISTVMFSQLMTSPSFDSGPWFPKLLMGDPW